MSWYLQAMRKYADFSGRARRREYWFFMLFYAVFALVIVVLGLLFAAGSASLTNMGEGIGAMGVIYTLYVLGNLLPGLAVSVRRLHDTGRSGWWLFIALVPGVGGIILLVFDLLDSQLGANQFGPNPKGLGPADYSPGPAYAAQP